MFYTAVVVSNVDANLEGCVEVIVPVFQKVKSQSAEPEEKEITNKFALLNTDVNEDTIKKVKTIQCNTIPAYPIALTASNHGQYLIPEVGDEILVFFKDDNLQMCNYLYASLYKKARIMDFGELIEDAEQNKDPSKKVDQKVLLKTKSNHILCFNDCEVNNGIILKASGKHKLKMESHEKVSAITLQSEQGRKIILDDTNEGILITSTDGHKIAIDDKEKGINLTSADGNRVTVDDKNGLIQLVSSSGTGLQFDTKKNKLIVDAQDIEETAKTNISLDSEKSIALKSNTDIKLDTTNTTIDSKAQAKISASTLSIEVKGKCDIKSNGMVNVEGQMVTVNGTMIKLGTGAANALLKTTEFMTLFNTHSHGTAVGPSTPPVAPLLPTMLSTKVFNE